MQPPDEYERLCQQKVKTQQKMYELEAKFNSLSKELDYLKPMSRRYKHINAILQHLTHEYSESQKASTYIDGIIAAFDQQRAQQVV